MFSHCKSGNRTNSCDFSFFVLSNWRANQSTGFYMITASVMKVLNKTVFGSMLVYFKNISQLILNIIQETYETSTFKKLNWEVLINEILVFWVPFFRSLSFCSSSVVLGPCFRWCHRFWGYCFFRFWFRLLVLDYT